MNIEELKIWLDKKIADLEAIYTEECKHTAVPGNPFITAIACKISTFSQVRDLIEEKKPSTLKSLWLRITCNACRGSGEGLVDGDRCFECNGEGTYTEEDDNAEEPEK